jgi:hypothetical protein
MEELKLFYKLGQTAKFVRNRFFFLIFFRLQVSSLELEYEVGGVGNGVELELGRVESWRTEVGRTEFGTGKLAKRLEVMGYFSN